MKWIEYQEVNLDGITTQICALDIGTHNKQVALLKLTIMVYNVHLSASLFYSINISLYIYEMSFYLFISLSLYLYIVSLFIIYSYIYVFLLYKIILLSG